MSKRRHFGSLYLLLVQRTAQNSAVAEKWLPFLLPSLASPLSRDLPPTHSISSSTSLLEPEPPIPEPARPGSGAQPARPGSSRNLGV